MRKPLLRLSLLAALLGPTAACDLPQGDDSTPEGAHYGWLGALGRGDDAALWELLDPAIRAQFEAWLEAERAAVREIRAAYPKDDIAAAIAALDGGRRGDLPDARRLFAALRATEVVEPVSGIAALGARVRSVTVDETAGQAVLKTWGGDTVTVVADEGGRWHMSLPEAESARLASAREQAERNLARVRRNLKKLAGQGG